MTKSDRRDSVQRAMLELARALELAPEVAASKRFTRADAYAIGMDAWDEVIGDKLGKDEIGHVVRGSYKSALDHAIEARVVKSLGQELLGVPAVREHDDVPRLFRQPMYGGDIVTYAGSPPSERLIFGLVIDRGHKDYGVPGSPRISVAWNHPHGGLDLGTEEGEAGLRHLYDDELAQHEAAIQALCERQQRPAKQRKR